MDGGQSVDGGLITWSHAGILRTVYRVLVTSTAGISVEALPPLVRGLGDGGLPLWVPPRHLGHAGGLLRQCWGRRGGPGTHWRWWRERSACHGMTSSHGVTSSLGDRGWFPGQCPGPGLGWAGFSARQTCLGSPGAPGRGHGTRARHLHLGGAVALVLHPPQGLK